MIRSIKTLLTLCTLSAALALTAQRARAATLDVGPGQHYATPSAALAAAHDGDTIRISTAGTYTNDVAQINKNNLVIEGVGPGRALIKTDGRVFGQKGIWLFAQGSSNLTIRNIDLEGARVSQAEGANGAGLRAQGTNLTVDNCRFSNNQDGILGGIGTTTIEHCEFDHNGLTDQTHNIYINDQAGTLIFRFNYSHDTAIGHLLKSRAAVNIIQYNRLSDDRGTGSYELDLPNGGAADIIGNLIQQSAASQNGTILAYGEEGIVSPKSQLNIVNNTFINDRRAGIFINARKLPADFKLLVLNNIFAGPGTMTTARPTRSAGNLALPIAAAGFINPAAFNFHLAAHSPAIGIGVPPGADSADRSLLPTNEYASALKDHPRPARTPLDAGAFAATAK